MLSGSSRLGSTCSLTPSLKHVLFTLRRVFSECLPTFNTVQCASKHTSEWRVVIDYRAFKMCKLNITTYQCGLTTARVRQIYETGPVNNIATVPFVHKRTQNVNKTKSDERLTWLGQSGPHVSCRTILYLRVLCLNLRQYSFSLFLFSFLIFCFLRSFIFIHHPCVTHYRSAVRAWLELG